MSHRYRKRIFNLILAVVVIVTSTLTAGIPSYATSFSDIANHWAKSYIETISTYDVVSGYANGTFKPNNKIQRIEFIAIIVNAQGIDTRSPLRGEYWGQPFIEAALKNGLITLNEYGSMTEFTFNQSISREEMASIVVNAYIKSGGLIDPLILDEASAKLSDLNTVSPSYYDKAIASVALDFITGTPYGTFAPKDNADRATAAVLSYKLLVKLGTITVDTINGGSSQTNPALTLSTSFAVNNIEIGDSYDWVIKNYGVPIREDASEYNFKWLIYHNKYADYYQIGIQNNKVVALYTASDLLSSKYNVLMGFTKAQVNSALGQPLTEILKGNISYVQYNSEDTALYYKDGVYLTAFYDTSNSGKLFAISLIDKTVETNFTKQYGTPSDTLRVSYEQEIFDLTNVYRVSKGVLPVKWSEKIAITARKHSKDMAVRNFFDHINPSGYSPFDRILADGIDYRLAAENIAAGYTNALTAHAGWVNSPGHRDNLVRDIEFLGVGVYFGGSYFNYYTQNFYTL